MKKFFQILIVPIILLSLCVNVCAETVYTEDSLNYIIRDDEVIITKYFGTEEEVIVPQLINNMPVTVIASGAFVNTYAKRVYLPDSIAYIEPGAFSSNVVYSGKYEEDPENPQEEKEEDHRIDNNDGSIENIPTIEIKEGEEKGEVDADGKVISNSDNSNTINKDIAPTSPSSIEKTYKISPILYVLGIVIILLIVYVIIRKVRKNKND